MERTKGGRDISVRVKGCRIRIARNRTGSIFTPINYYLKRSGAKIIKGELPRRAGILACTIVHAKEVVVSE